MQILLKRVQKFVSITEHQPRKLPLLVSFYISGSALRITILLKSKKFSQTRVSLTLCRVEFTPFSSFTCSGDVFISNSVKSSSLGNKELCKMICHMKYIFVWIFLILQPTGNLFIWDFVPIFSLFTFFRIRTQSIHLIIYFIQVIFILIAAE